MVFSLKFAEFRYLLVHLFLIILRKALIWSKFHSFAVLLQNLASIIKRLIFEEMFNVFLLLYIDLFRSKFINFENMETQMFNFCKIRPKFLKRNTQLCENSRQLLCLVTVIRTNMRNPKKITN